MDWQKTQNPPSGKWGTARRRSIMSKKHVLSAATFVVVILFATSLVAAAETGLTLDRWIIASGGSQATNGGTALQSTIGQPFVYQVESSGFELCSGFLCSTQSEFYLYIPTLLKD
jgi:hypothetical protein